MARPRDPLIEERILDATATLIADHGYAALTMEAIAERAGRSHEYRPTSSPVRCWACAALPPFPTASRRPPERSVRARLRPQLSIRCVSATGVASRRPEAARARAVQAVERFGSESDAARNAASQAGRSARDAARAGDSATTALERLVKEKS